MRQGGAAAIARRVRGPSEQRALGCTAVGIVALCGQQRRCTADKDKNGAHTKDTSVVWREWLKIFIILCFLRRRLGIFKKIIKKR